MKGVMAAHSNKRPAWFITFVLLLLTASASSSSAQCVDGSYEHEGKTCCQCAAGQYLVKHCTTDPNDRKCEPCGTDTYSGHPNNQESCDPCTSCSHPNGNLEVDEACDPARDTKCRCKKDHYCVSGEENCKLCHPCKTCADGIKIPCKGHNDTVCNEKTGGNQGGMIAGIIIGIIAVAAVGAAVYFWKKRKSQQMCVQKKDGHSVPVEMQPLKDVDLQPLLPDIADLIGWKSMKRIAMRSSISNATIDAVKQNNREDVQEQTLELLKIFVEHEGKGTAKNLIDMLEKDRQKDKGEKVKALLSRGPELSLSA